MNGIDVPPTTNPVGPGWGTALVNAIGGISTLAIDVSGSYLEWNRQGHVTITLDNSGTFSGNYILRVVLIEDNLFYMGDNGHPNHYATMRDMIPTANGTTVTLAPNSQTVADLDFAVPNIVVQENASLVVFVQHPTNHTVLNAERVSVSSLIPDCQNPPGDVGGDMSVNVQDVVQLVDIIIGTISPEGCMIQAADLNNDSQINVQDVVLLVSMILGN